MRGSSSLRARGQRLVLLRASPLFKNRHIHGNMIANGQQSSIATPGVSSIENIQKVIQAVDLNCVESVQKAPGSCADGAHDSLRAQPPGPVRADRSRRCRHDG